MVNWIFRCIVNNEQQQKNIETKESRVILQKIDFITFYLSQDFLAKPVKQYYNNNKKRIKTLKEYYTKESRWLLTFLLSQKIDFITFFLSKTLIKKFVKPWQVTNFCIKFSKLHLSLYIFISSLVKKGQVS